MEHLGSLSAGKHAPHGLLNERLLAERAEARLLRGEAEDAGDEERDGRVVWVDQSADYTQRSAPEVFARRADLVAALREASPRKKGWVSWPSISGLTPGP